MAYARKIVLHCPDGYKVGLDRLVADFLRDGVRSVAVVGKDCASIEDTIDWLVIGDASDESRFLLTSSHPDETVAEAIEFAQALAGEEYAGQVQLVRL